MIESLAPVLESAIALYVKISAPAPPVKVSPPLLPSIVSAPPLPLIVSPLVVVSVPVRVSPAVPPVRAILESFSAVPSKVRAVVKPTPLTVAKV